MFPLGTHLPREQDAKNAYCGKYPDIETLERHFRDNNPCLNLDKCACHNDVLALINHLLPYYKNFGEFGGSLWEIDVRDEFDRLFGRA